MSDIGAYFNRQFCGKVIRTGAIACAAIFVGDVLLLVLFDPAHSRCAGTIHKLIGGGSIWELVAAAGLWARG